MKIMNYYNPNFYQNSLYGNSSMQYLPQQSLLNQTVPQIQNPNALNMPNFNGKLVDSADVVKATEVPIGGYGIFPKADLSEIYIKSWNNNGTTNITTFKPDIPMEILQKDEKPNIDFSAILEKITNLENKLDLALQTKEVSSATSSSVNTLNQTTTKGITANDY